MGDPKKYHLTEEESKNIKFRRMVMSHVAESINAEMSGYVYQVVRPRLNLDPDVQLELSDDGMWLIEVPQEPKILLPNDK